MAMVAPKSAPTVSSALATGYAVNGPPGRIAPKAVPINKPFRPDCGPSERDTLSCGNISAMKAPSRQPASTRGRMPPNSVRSWVRISVTPLMPSRRQTSVALTATSTPIVIIDQPIGFRFRPGRGSASAASSAGAGSFKGSSVKGLGLARCESWFCLVSTARRCKWKRYPTHARLMDAHAGLVVFVLTRFLHANRPPPRIKCGAGFRSKTLCKMPHQREAGEQARNREHHRPQHVEQRRSDLAALIKHRGIERERREGGVAAENAGHQEQPPMLRRVALEREIARDQAHDDGAGDVDDEGVIRKSRSKQARANHVEGVAQR